MDTENESPVNQLLAKLTQQQEVLARQKLQVEENDGDDSSSATDPYANTPPTESVDTSDGRPDSAEVFRLKKELELTRERMAQMEIEVNQSRLAKHTVEEAIGSPFPTAQHLAFNFVSPGIVPPQITFQGRASPFRPRGHTAQGVGANGLWVDTGLPSAGTMYPPQQ
jgi:hypothetical protein